MRIYTSSKTMDAKLFAKLKKKGERDWMSIESSTNIYDDDDAGNKNDDDTRNDMELLAKLQSIPTGMNILSLINMHTV